MSSGEKTKIQRALFEARGAVGDRASCAALGFFEQRNGPPDTFFRAAFSFVSFFFPQKRKGLVVWAREPS
jgi:hypothetical protein